MRYMVTIRFRPQQQAEIAALIPQEQAHIKGLRDQGIVEALYISAERSLVWIIMQTTSQERVQQELEALPLYPYMELEVLPLA